jgi:hypothetical protein
LFDRVFPSGKTLGAIGAIFAQSIHYGIGVSVGGLIGSHYVTSPQLAGGSHSVGFSLEFGQRFKGTNFGYNFGIGSNSFERNIFQTHESQYTSDLRQAKIGASYAIKKYGVDLLSSVIYGNYSHSVNSYSYFIFEDDLEDSWLGFGYQVPVNGVRIGGIFRGDYLQQTGVFGLEVGARKQFLKGFYAQVSYNHVPLDRGRLGISNLKWADVSLKYFWGKR